MKKDFNLDFLRVMSMLLVIVIHVANYYGKAFHQISHVSFFGSVIFNTVTRVCVPIFFMISGALLLSKEYDARKNRTRIYRNCVVLGVFTIIYLFWDQYYMGVHFDSYLELIGHPERTMLWFMYAIIALYISLPFIKRMVDNLNRREEKLFVLLWLGMNGLLNLIDIKVSYQIPVVSGTYYLGYFIIGYLIRKYKDQFPFKKYNIPLIIVTVLSFACTIILTYIHSINENTNDKTLLTYSNILCMIPSLAIFILVYFNRTNRESKIIRFLSKYSFGIYLIHGILLNITMNYFDYVHINSFFGIPFSATIIFLSSLIVVYMLKKIPLINAWI